MTARRSFVVTLGFLLAFALLVVVGGSFNSGYEHGRDYVSSLASRGADQAWIGVLAIACFAAAHAVAAQPWRRMARIVWASFLVCSVLLLVLALARASCPRGAARCALPGTETPTDVGDTIHGLSVGIYALTFVIAMICTGVVLLRRHRRGPGATVLLLAALSVLALSQFDEGTPGAKQRVWFSVNGLGLLAVARLASSDEADRGPGR